MKPWESLISLERIMELHGKAMTKVGQAPTVDRKTRDCVDGRLGNAWTGESYVGDARDARPGLCFAGFLLFYLVRDHCFPDGNKRIGWVAAMEILARIGLTVKATDDEATDFVTRIADQERDDSVKSGLDASLWLAGRLEAPAV